MAGDYGLLSRLLHRLALGSDAVAEISFGIDQAMARKPARVAEGRHVFVSGLARAGTTVLMRRIHESGAFRSLTYDDMPFVLAPNFWRLLRGGRGPRVAPTERAHGDGVMVGSDSPESLEEVFWRVFDGPGYIGADRLLPHEPSKDLLLRYQAYIAAILATAGAGTRYLAKNNNNILRLGSLQRLFPNAVILVPFRHPAAQAASLKAQHLRFRELHASDPFAADYMRWLVHHEFGGDHRAFAAHAPSARLPHDVAYWVDQWIGVYRWLFETAPPEAIFICYEDLCADPAVWADIARRVDIPATAGGSAFEQSARSIDTTDLPGDLRREADSIYEGLRRRQRIAA